MVAAGTIEIDRGGPRPQEISAMTPAELSALQATYRDGLLADTLPFWLRHGLDRTCGGLLTGLDRDGTVIDTDKAIWLQGRAAWTFSTLADSSPNAGRNGWRRRGSAPGIHSTARARPRRKALLYGDHAAGVAGRCGCAGMFTARLSRRSAAPPTPGRRGDGRAAGGKPSAFFRLTFGIVSSRG